MKKYNYIALYQFKANKVYKLNTFFAVISSLIFILINYSIWRSLYLAGYISEQKFNLTISHVVIINVLNQIINRNFEELIGDKIVTGDMAYYLTKPTSALGKLVAEHMGDILYNFTFSAIPLIVLTCSLLDIVSVINVANLGLFFISTLLSFVTIIAFEAVIGLLSIFMYQIFGLSLIKTSLINILAGISIPISYYPEAIRSIFTMLPFYSAFNAPIAMILNESYYCSGVGGYLLSKGWMHNVYYTALIDQFLWMIFFFLIISLLWKRLIRRICIQGG